jgi:hypothetical protein
MIEMVDPLKRYRGGVSVDFGSVNASFPGEVYILEFEDLADRLADDVHRSNDLYLVYKEPPGFRLLISR